MCGIGRVIATVTCEKVQFCSSRVVRLLIVILKVAGPTSAPLTTAKPCIDKYTNCADLAKTNCKANAEHCPQVFISTKLGKLSNSCPFPISVSFILI